MYEEQSLKKSFVNTDKLTLETCMSFMQVLKFLNALLCHSKTP